MWEIKSINKNGIKWKGICMASSVPPKGERVPLNGLQDSILHWVIDHSIFGWCFFCLPWGLSVLGPHRIYFLSWLIPSYPAWLLWSSYIISVLYLAWLDSLRTGKTHAITQKSGFQLGLVLCWHHLLCLLLPNPCTSRNLLLHSTLNLPLGSALSGEYSVSWQVNKYPRVSDYNPCLLL